MRDYLGNLHRRIQNFLFGYEVGRRILRGRGLERPAAPWENGVLNGSGEWKRALEEVERLGLPSHPEPTKNWDSLAALHCILAGTTRDARILDAGAERYSVILPWLCLYGYRDLHGINLSFDSVFRRGPITYEPGDITATRYEGDSFDAVTCLSVVEHGVDIWKYFMEMSRILKPGGVLVTSVDYYETPLDTAGKTAYGVPVHIFSREEILEALSVAGAVGFALRGEDRALGRHGPGLHVPGVHIEKIPPGRTGCWTCMMEKCLPARSDSTFPQVVGFPSTPG